MRTDSAAPPVALTTLAGWPQSWQDGVFDLAGSGSGDAVVAFVRGGEVLLADLALGTVTVPPIPLSEGFKGDILARLTAGGVNALLYDGSVTSAGVPLRLFRGATVTRYTGTQPATPGTEAYLPGAFAGWPSVWNPVLLQAPAGPAGATWAVDRVTSELLVHDGQAWSEVPLPAGATGVPSVDAGADGSVFAASGTALYQLDTGGAAPAWRSLAATPGTVAQVAVGDAGHVWVRAQGGTVYRYSGGSGGTFVSALNGQTAAHVSANADGTLWHCSPGQTGVYRLISEGTQPSEALAVAGGATVQRVASTGFGTARVLAQQGGTPQVFAYQSPYVFKTGPRYSLPGYSPLDVGVGAVFLSAYETDPEETGSLVALDVLTGQERWRRDVKGISFTNPVYDANLGLVYIAGTDGIVSALDVQTGGTLWEYQTGSLVVAPPALSGTRLCFGDESGHVHLLDTVAALQAWQQHQPLDALWIFKGETGPQGTRVATPLIADGSVYVQAWLQTGYEPGRDEATLTSSCTRLDLATGKATWQQQEKGIVVPGGSTKLSGGPLGALGPPLSVQALFDSSKVKTPVPAVVFNELTRLRATPVDPVPASHGDTHFPLPGTGSIFSSGMTAAGGQVYVGDSAGTLRVLDPASSAQSSSFGWSIVAQLPAPGGLIATTPVVAGPVGSETVVYAVYGSGVQEVRFFTPGTGQVATLATGQTSVSSLSRDLAAGVVYAGGDASWNASDHAAGQVFAIRADAAASAVGAFIAESQLLQDFDDPPGGPDTGDPVPAARYQTHLTVVASMDGQNAAASGTAVKVWADAPTSVTINGQPFQIGPGPALTDAAAVETGADGVVTIVGDATDFSTPALRVWAPFMDPSERVVIYPDQEFHLRLAGCTAQTSDAGLDFGTINLGTCATYDGTQPADQPAAGLVPGQRRHLRDGRRGVRSLRAGAARPRPRPHRAGRGRPRRQPGQIPGLRRPSRGGVRPRGQPGGRRAVAAGPAGIVLDATGRLTVTSAGAAVRRRRPGREPPHRMLNGSIGDWFRRVGRRQERRAPARSRSSSA